MAIHSAHRVGWVSACALLLVGGGVGALLERTLERAPVTARRIPSALNPTTPAAIQLTGLEELPGILERLDKTLRTLGKKLGEPAPNDTAPTTRQPIEAAFPTSRDDDSLAAALHELSAALRTLPGNSAASTRSFPAGSPRSIDRSSAFAFTQSLRQASLIEDDGDSLELSLAPFRKNHLLWTIEEILDTFGPPDWVNTNGNESTRWVYELLESGTEEESFYFTFVRDRVSDVGYDYSRDDG